MTIKVGITGGIGSGKTTVCNVFKLLDIPVFEADTVAKNLYDTNTEIKSGLIKLFGEDIYQPDNKLNRKKLAAYIFSNELQLTKVNELVHPVVREEFEKWLTIHENSPYIIHEAAILFESGFYKLMDFSILITAPETERIKRVMLRDGITETMVRERISKQWSEEKKQKFADLILQNDNKNLIIPEIIKTDKNLRDYGKIR